MITTKRLRGMVMRKRMFWLMIALCVAVMSGFVGFSILRTNQARSVFAGEGYVLVGDETGTKQIGFADAQSYQVYNSGKVRFLSASGDEALLERDSFVYYEDGGIMALADGILLDFKDLSDNFINNYFLNAGLTIYRTGDTYAAETTAGAMSFGEHMWKLSDQKYLIAAPALKVCFSEEDQREVTDYVQVTVTDDCIVQMLTT